MTIASVEPHCSEKWQQFHDILSEDGHGNPQAFHFTMNRMFAGIAFKDKTVLEIGSGRGLMSIYAALAGAKTVVSMEPEMAGSRSNVADIQRERLERLEVTNITQLSADFNEWDSSTFKCDIVMMFAVVNHLHESPFNARWHEETFRNYTQVATKVHSILNPGGVVIVTDACRYGLFAWLKQIGIRRPWRRRRSSIDWRIHQNPSMWKRIFRSAGFSESKISYPVPYCLRRFAFLADTSLTNFCLNANFIARFYK